MSPTKSLIRTALAVLLLASPAALAEEVAAPMEAQQSASAPAEESLAEAPMAPEAEGELAPADPVAEDLAPADLAEAPASDVTSESEMPESDASEMPESDASELAPLAQTDEAAPEALDEAVPAAADDSAMPGDALGAVAYDSNGRRGRIHIVVRGDTLWDISNAYLGTPWVWPSIWKDNGEIENPHLIYPGDHIWITPGEMRKVTPEEAAIMLSNLPPEPSEPAAQEDVAPLEAPEPPAQPAIAEPAEYGSVRVANRESAGVITPEQMEASASIVARERERMMLAQEDEVYIGLGEGQVQVGDQLTVFRTHEKVFDPDTGVLLGYHVEFLGWVEVTKTAPETSLVRIRMSDDGLQEGDRVMPRTPLPAEIALRASPDVEGKISFFPQKRVVIGYNDFVYLNRGSIDGLEVGSPLDVYRPGYPVEEEVRNETVMVPDYVIGRLVVVRTEDESAVAWVMRSNTELALGDHFRGAGR